MARWLGLYLPLMMASSVGVEARLKPDAVLYGVVPPMFGSPPLRSILNKLDDLRDLGVDVIWLLPINDTDDPGHISYAITDYFKIRPDFGSLEDLRELTRKAHERGMMVIMDFVPNHTSNQHPYFLDATDRGSESPYYNFYDRDSAGKPTYYFNWYHLPNLNFSNPDVIGHITSAFEYWIRSADIDGFRVDVAWGIHDRRPEYWAELNQQLRKLKSHAFMLAEAGARDTYYFENGFDAAYDWTDSLGEWAWKEAFDHPEKAGIKLAEALRKNSDPSRVVRFLNNNDTGDRFLTRYGLDFTKAAVILQFSVAGLPTLFCGDEVGAEFSPYEDPPPIDWRDPMNLRPFYKKLIQLRKQEAALHSGEMEILSHEGSESVIAFTRKSDHHRLLALINFGEMAKVKVKVQTTADRFMDLVSGEMITASLAEGVHSFSLPAKSGFILRIPEN